MNIFKKNTEKHTEKLPMTGKVKKGFRIYCTVIMGAALVLGTSVTAFAANDPITVINNLSTFIFGLIRAIGLILLGFGVVQIGLSAVCWRIVRIRKRSFLPQRQVLASQDVC